MYFNKKVSDSSKMSWDALIKQESGNFTETGHQWSSKPRIKKTLFISSNHGFSFLPSDSKASVIKTLNVF